ncbi:MAG: hypothetical protein H0T84_04075 [Tatlockia sp.]|nr:hypothetical protein [Tatlockia sp.]
MLNKALSFLFINSKINSLLLESTNKKFIDEALIAKLIYKKQIRRYLGLGFILSFIPDSDPFKARINLLAVIERGEEETSNDFIKSPFHILFRTFYELITVVENEELKLTEILFEKKNLKWGINRINPFFYLFKFLQDLTSSLKQGPGQTDSIFGALLWLAVLAIGIVSYYVTIILYFLSEPLFNFLHTLLIEPFIFAAEVINQKITDHSMDYALIPTDEFYKVNKIVTAFEPANLIIDAEITPTLTLLTGSEEKIYNYKKHHSGLFFKKYQDTDLFEKSNKTIAEANAELQLTAFKFFNKERLPMDIIDKISQHRIDII